MEKRSKRVLSWIAACLAVLLLGGVLGFFLGRREERQQSSSAEAETNFIVKPTEAKSGVLIESIPATVANMQGAYVLTATVMPASATNKKVNWTVAWVDPGDSWASGKRVTDYVAVEPTSDGSLQARVVCLQPFGVQIKVVCTSRQNPSAKAECLCDFVKQVEYFRWNLKSSYMSASTFVSLYPGCTVTRGAAGSMSVAGGRGYPVGNNAVELTYSDYTADNDLSFNCADSYVCFTDEFVTSFNRFCGSKFENLKVPELLGSLGTMQCYLSLDEYRDTGDEDGTGLFIFGVTGIKISNNFFSRLLGYGWGSSVSVDSALIFLWNKFISWLETYPSDFCYEIHVLFKGSRKDYDFAFDVRYDPSDLEVYPEV